MPKEDKKLEIEDELIIEDGEIEAVSLSNKLKNLRNKLKAAEAEKMVNLSGWQRAKADYSNLKNSAERERNELVKLIKAEVIEDFLPLADSFEMAMSDQEAWEAVPENWRKGVEYIYNQLESILAAHGVIVIDPLGLIFDPQDHESVGIIETDQAGEDNFILEVKKKGYKLGQRLIRPAQVKIGEYNKKGKKIINFLI